MPAARIELGHPLGGSKRAGVDLPVSKCEDCRGALPLGGLNVWGQLARAVVVVMLCLCLWSDQVERSTRQLVVIPASGQHDLPTIEIGSFITVEVEGLPVIGDLA